MQDKKYRKLAIIENDMNANLQEFQLHTKDWIKSEEIKTLQEDV